MRKNSLKATGLSLSQAQSVSNSCNQHVVELETVLSKINNYSKTIKVNGEEHVLQSGYPLPTNIVSVIEEIGSLRATQAFLMENIKTKDGLIKEIQGDTYARKQRPEMESYEAPTLLKQVGEEWGWEQLGEGDLNEYYDVEAKASVIGKFIHKNGELSKLRNELPNIPGLEWMEIETGKKTPVIIIKHNKAEDLLTLHDTLSVNYYKAKVKNLVTAENARIANINADLISATNKINSEREESYQSKIREWNSVYQKELNEFEKQRQERIKGVVDLRIDVPTMFQTVVDKFFKPEVKK